MRLSQVETQSGAHVSGGSEIKSSIQYSLHHSFYIQFHGSDKYQDQEGYKTALKAICLVGFIFIQYLCSSHFYGSNYKLEGVQNCSLSLGLNS